MRTQGKKVRFGGKIIRLESVGRWVASTQGKGRILTRERNEGMRKGGKRRQNGLEARNVE